MCPRIYWIPVIVIPDRLVSFDVYAVMVFVEVDFVASLTVNPLIVIVMSCAARPLLPAVRTNLLSVKVAGVSVCNDDAVALGAVEAVLLTNKPSAGNSIVTVSVLPRAMVVVNLTISVGGLEVVVHAAVPVIRVLGIHREVA